MNIPEFSESDLYSEIYKEVMLNKSMSSKKELARKIADIAYNYPMDSEEFDEGMRLIKISDAFKGYVLCHDRQWENGHIPDGEITRMIDDNRWKDILSDTHTFCDSPFFHDRFSFKKRSDVEFDARHKQVCVGALITDYRNILCLKTHDRGRIPNKLTLIQGHVDFDKSAYTTTQMQFIKSNMLREIYEETQPRNPEDDNKLLLGVEFQMSDIPDYIINTKRVLTNIEHLGFIYVIRVEKCHEVLKLITTAEPNKHDVVLGPLVVDDQMDEWLKLVIGEIAK